MYSVCHTVIQSDLQSWPDLTVLTWATEGFRAWCLHRFRAWFNGISSHSLLIRSLRPWPLNCHKLATEKPRLANRTSRAKHPTLALLLGDVCASNTHVKVSFSVLVNGALLVTRSSHSSAFCPSLHVHCSPASCLSFQCASFLFPDSGFSVLLSADVRMWMLAD